MSNFKIQAFRNLENVNADNMTTFYNNTPQELTSFFPITPCICNGVGNIINNFGQVGTSNVFAFTNGVVRFPDQTIPVLTTIAPCFATYNSASVTVTSPSSPGSQYYIVANVTFTALDTYNSQTSVAILGTAMTLAQIAAASNPLAYMPICAITNTSGVYTVFIDSNCAQNYGLNYGVTSLVNSDASGNIYTVNATSTGCNLIAGTGHMIQPPNGRAYSGNPSGAQIGGSATYATLADLPILPAPISITANGSTRAYYTGGSATVTDPALTFAYISELPVVTNNIRGKVAVVGDQNIYMNATFNGSTWNGNVGGVIDLAGIDVSTYNFSIDLNSTLGITGATGVGGFSYSTANFPVSLPSINDQVIICASSIASFTLSFSAATSGAGALRAYFNFAFTATSIT